MSHLLKDAGAEPIHFMAEPYRPVSIAFREIRTHITGSGGLSVRRGKREQGTIAGFQPAFKYMRGIFLAKFCCMCLYLSKNYFSAARTGFEPALSGVTIRLFVHRTAGPGKARFFAYYLNGILHKVFAVRAFVFRRGNRVPRSMFLCYIPSKNKSRKKSCERN